ncbi:hypothetical protein BpsS36_00017 [Bacillus phage vB_BpsS-36]|uniref:Uncharacterized protein n=1 Tax=Bacillus phage vB_BpsS-36 TaxID=2419622 RepID=A0A3G3BWQ3_9CAUD|nr:hypothetical protein BpsS36_00017 [Bacillus phage vB_BpsS-36]
MGQSHGFDNTVVIGKESSFGTPATSFKWIGIVESFDPSESHNVDSRKAVGVRAPFMLRQGQREVDGSLSVALQNARLFAYALGKVATSSSGGGNEHVITPIGKGEELPSLTVQNSNPAHNLTRNYVGGKVDSLSLSASSGEAVTVDADIQFTHVEDEGITPATVTAELDNYFMFYEGSVKVNNSDVADITSFDLEIANNLDRRFTLNGQNKPARIEEGNLDITASLTMDFTNKTQWDIFKNGETVAIELNLVDVADPNHSLRVTLTGGLYDSNSLNVGAEDLQEQELDAIFTDIEIVAVDGNAELI